MKTSLVVVIVASAISYLIAICFGSDIIKLFAKGNTEVIKIAEQGLSIFAVTFLMEGVCVFISGFFTSVNNGKLSAMVSFLKTFVFTLGFIFTLPPMLGMDGVWLSVPLSEGAALLISCYLIWRTSKTYFQPTEVTQAQHSMQP